MNAGLDKDGLIYLWSKIKALFNRGITGLSISGKVITYTKGDGTTGTITTQDTNTTYSKATQSADGLMSSDDKTKLDGIATGANKYVHPTTSGSKHIPSGGSSGQILRWSADGTAAWGADNDTTYEDMTGATSSAAGTHGLVPAPAAGNQAKYLRGDGTWQTPTNTTYSVFKGATASANGSSGLVPAPNTNAYSGGFFLGADGTWQSADESVVTEQLADSFNIQFTHASGNNDTASIPAATQSLAGVMSAADKTKLDGIATGANKYVHPTTSGNKHIPSGGSSGQILRWSADGTAVWGADNNTTYSDATQSTHGLMSTADKKKLDAFGAASTYALKSDITNMYKYKGSVTDASKLPTTGQTTGDVYNIESASIYGGAGMNVAWNGSAWDPLGEIFTITAITNEEIDAICV